MEGTEAAATTRSIVVDVSLSHPVEKVWRALTDPDCLAHWLMPNDFRAFVGHSFRFRAPAMPGWDGVVECEVLEIVPLKRVKYTWTGGPPTSLLDTTVTYTLTTTLAGCAVRLEHAGFTAQNDMAYDAMSKGWQGKVSRQLQEVVSNLD